MKSKPIFLFILHLFFISCNPDHSLEVKEKVLVPNIQQARDELTTQNTQNLIGKWGIYERISGGLEINCNSCPNIEFYKDLTGVVIKPSGEKESVRWIMEENIITFINTDGIESNTISDGKYEMVLTQENGIAELILKKTGTDFSYILRR